MNKERLKCPIEIALDTIGGKWKALILWYLLDDTKRFSELERQIPQISQKVLVQQLRELEEDGLIKRQVYPLVPPKVEYSISQYGMSIRPLLMLLLEWGTRHSEASEKVLGRAVHMCNSVEDMKSLASNQAL
jgi:DNA-binding HxlR family transcriptional regulator